MIEQLRGHFSGYTGIFLLCAFSGLGVPVPEDIAVLFAGTRVGVGALQPVQTVIVVFVGFLARDLMAYGIGRVLGAPVLDHRWTRRFLGGKRLDRAQKMLTERGPVAVLFARMLIGMRVPVFIVTGAGRVPLRQFILFDALGLCVTAPLGVGIGYAFGPSLLELANRIVGSASLVTATLVVVVLVLIGLKRRARRKAAMEPAEDSPPVVE